MTFNIVKDAWVNPASPYKYLEKKEGRDRTEKGRIIQGEKGIGRFAAFKIGATVEIFTHSVKDNNKEVYLKADLSSFDEELITRKDEKSEKPIFVDNIKYFYEIRDKADEIIEKEITVQGIAKKRPPNGTLIRITNLKRGWTQDQIKEIFEDCLKLVSPFKKTEFIIHILVNGETIFSSDDKGRLNDLLDRAPLRLDGNFDKDGNMNFVLNGKKSQKSLNEMIEFEDIRDHFYTKNEELKRKPECGPFSFKFYVFDFETGKPSSLDKNDKDLIRSHRIYLYRDDIRVYPYGDPNDDWIGLDVLRGTYRLGEYLSNDQIVGYIGITNKNNPDLRDKTNREGLMDIGNSYEDLRYLILGILDLLNKEFKKYKIDQEIKLRERKQKKGLFIQEPKVEKAIISLSRYFEEKKDSEGIKLTKILEKDHQEEKKILTDRAEIVEDLAAVGMTVDAASHDLMIMMGRASETLNLLVKMSETKNFDHNKLQEELEKLRGQYAFIEDQLNGIQPLFRSSRRRSKDWRIKDIISKVLLYYTVPIEERKIKIDIKEKSPPLVVKCPEAVLLQVFINLMDNAIYWLAINDKKEKIIEVLIDGINLEVTFADNGPGVQKDDLPYIFEPFFSTKGIRGRGLGLYIARQLLERYDYEIDYIENKKDIILDGANFIVNFGKSEE